MVEDKKEIVNIDLSKYFDIGHLNGPTGKVILYLEERTKSLTAEHELLSPIELSFNGWEDYGEYDIEIDLGAKSTHLETDEELGRRVYYQNLNKESTEERERAKLKELLEKYGNE